MERKKRVSVAQKPKIIPLKMDATFFFEKAVQSLDRYHYDKALKYFRRAVEYEPENPVNHCNLAGILSEMGNYSESNKILQRILDEIDQSMTECHFYMANNYANMEDYEAAERALVQYLENDPTGQFLEESQEMMELLSYELDRPLPLISIKSREGLIEHDQARILLEEGKFVEAVRQLEKIVRKHSDFPAARNNLALAYYYTGQFEKAFKAIREVLEQEPGNLHALCNLAIFYHHLAKPEEALFMARMLKKVHPYHQEHIFKLATTMGILGEHEHALRLLKRLIKGSQAPDDPCLYHYAAVAACNTGRYDEAHKFWKLAEKLDPDSEVPAFYLTQLEAIRSGRIPAVLNYHYHLPFEDPLRAMERTSEIMPEMFMRDPLIRTSFFWALRYGNAETKLQVIRIFGMIADAEMTEALKAFVQEPYEDDYLKKVALFVLRSTGSDEPFEATLGGRRVKLDMNPFTPNLPVWEERWQRVLESALSRMHKSYDLIQQHDMETLWVEFLTRTFPDVPKITKAEGWSAALEYLTAKMHRRDISYHEVSVKYGVSITTISKHVKMIDEACGLKEKMNAIFRKFADLEK